MWQQWETPLILAVITPRLFSPLPGHRYWQCNLALQKITKNGAIVSVSHSCGLLLYDSNVHKGMQLERAHNTNPDTVKHTCHYKVPVYVENALAKENKSLNLYLLNTALLSPGNFIWHKNVLRVNFIMSNDWSTASSKAIYLQATNQCFPFQFSVSPLFLKDIQWLVTSSSSSSHPFYLSFNNVF